MRLQPLPDIRLRIGDLLPFSVYSRSGSPLLRAGTPIPTDAVLQLVVARGFVDGDEDAVRRALVSAPPPPPTPLPRMLDELRGDLASLLAELRAGELDDTPGQIGALASRMQHAWTRDPEQVLGLLQMTSLDGEHHHRMLHTAVLVETLARAAGLPARERHSITCAALTCDLAMGRLQEAFGRQAGPLAPEQREQVQEHPDEAASLLVLSGVDDPLWLASVRHHHERLDGSGYPLRLGAEAVPMGARLLAICDIYTAMIRPRAWRPAFASRAALRDLFLERGQRVDADLAALFVKTLGVYPPGSLVRLANAELAVVVRQTADAAHPLVRTVVRADGSGLLHPSPRDTREPAHAIRELASLAQYRSVLGLAPLLWPHEEPLRAEA